MRQRVMIAVAIAARPKLLLADEPTTALDVTIQDQILALLAELQHEIGMAMILVSHDLGVVAENCDSVAVMYAGHVVEDAPAVTLFRSPSHPYTSALLRALPSIRTAGRRGRLPQISGQPPDLARLPPGCPFRPRCREQPRRVHRGDDGARARRPGPGDRVPVLAGGHVSAEPMLEVTDLVKWFDLRRSLAHRVTRTSAPRLTAVDGVSFSLARNRTLGIVGESGSGKTTLARCLTRLAEPDEGTVVFDGVDLGSLAGKELQGLRRRIQIVFQDPFTSLNPRLTVGAAIGEPAARARPRRPRRGPGPRRRAARARRPAAGCGPPLPARAERRPAAARRDRAQPGAVGPSC